MRELPVIVKVTYVAFQFVVTELREPISLETYGHIREPPPVAVMCKTLSRIPPVLFY